MCAITLSAEKGLEPEMLLMLFDIITRIDAYPKDGGESSMLN